MGHFRWLCLSHSEWLFYKSLTRQLHETQHRVIVPGAPHQTRFLPQRFPCDAAMEMGGSIGIPPIAGWFIRENPMNIDDNWGYPHEETSRYMFGAFQALKPRSQEWVFCPAATSQEGGCKPLLQLQRHGECPEHHRRSRSAKIACGEWRWMALLFVKGVTRKLLGGIPTPLKNMKVSWNDYSN